jgi:outer membrane protein assembly factor BamE (lipoprotein component of BamABCDE complex)
LFLENRTEKLIVKKSNKNDVIQIIGQPHTKSINNENEWIYIERVLTKGEYHKLGRNILKSNNVLYLVFDKYGVLENKKLFKKDDLKEIAFSERETTNDLTKKSFIEGFFSSLKAKMYRRK